MNTDPLGIMYLAYDKDGVSEAGFALFNDPDSDSHAEEWREILDEVLSSESRPYFFRICHKSEYFAYCLSR